MISLTITGTREYEGRRRGVEEGGGSGALSQKTILSCSPGCMPRMRYPTVDVGRSVGDG